MIAHAVRAIPGGRKIFQIFGPPPLRRLRRLAKGKKGLDGGMGDPWRGQELYALQGLDSFARTLGGGGCERQDGECGCWRAMPA